MEYLLWWSWKLLSPSLVFGWFFRILTPSEQSAQAILIETFLHWETFLFSILIFWIFEMRKTFNKWAAFPLYLFFFSPENTFASSTLSCLVCCYLFSFFLLDRPVRPSMNKTHLNLWMKGNLISQNEAKLGSQLQLSGGTWQVGFAQWFRLFRFYSWLWLLIHRSNSSEVSNVTSVSISLFCEEVNSQFIPLQE